MKQKSFAETAFYIVENYPNDEWHDRIKAEFPEASRDEIVAIVEVAIGGDVIVVDENGSTSTA